MFDYLSANIAQSMGALGALLFALFLLVRARGNAKAKKKLEEAVRLELHVPTSLHPVIDPDVCIGSGSCISACPEGKILQLVDGVATLVNASKCIGHGKCAAECPVDAIKLVFGSAERGVELPEVNEHFETSRPGVHIVGELAGMGLIRNALVQGLQVAARFRDSIDRTIRHKGLFDVAVVGAGPAGIATAVGCQAAGLSFVLVEQDTLGGTVAHYPRQKLVMTQPVELPYYGTFGKPTVQKEELVQAFQDVVTKAGVTVYEKAKVTAIEGEHDNFTVTTSRGLLRARRVVLAIGRRGTPRKLGVPGEDLNKVAYRLVDPTQYNGKRVLVVGGGDSALEAAIMVAEESTAEVRISYRRPEFARCRPLNKQRIDALIKKGRVTPMMSTELTAVETDFVTMKGNGPERLSNDYVIACLGGELPNEFLKMAGISIRRHTGTKAMANPALAGKSRSERKARRNAWMLFAIGLVIVCALAAVGYKYYLLPRELRFKAPDHKFLKPSGLWGHGIGILATMFMLLNFVYSIRKRMKMFKGKGAIATWLRFHVFVGLMSPLSILFHSAFQWGNQLATTTYTALVIVVMTGLIGRYIYGWFRLSPEDQLESKRLGVGLKELISHFPPQQVESLQAHSPAARHVFALADGSAALPSTLVGFFAGLPFESLRVRSGIHQARSFFLERMAYRVFRNQVLRLQRLRIKQHLHKSFKQLMNVWRVLHVALALTLLVLIGLHVWISIRVGFKWIWS